MKKFIGFILFSVLSAGTLRAATIPRPLGHAQVNTMVFPPAAVSVSSTTVVPVRATYITLVSTGGAMIMVSKPTISTNTVAGSMAFGNGTGGTGGVIADGTYIILGSTTTTSGITLQDNSVLAGTLLNLVTPSLVITSSTTVHLIFSRFSGRWQQIRGKDGN